MARKLGNRQLEILAELDSGNSIVFIPASGDSKRAKIRFSQESEVVPPNPVALGIYEDRKWVVGSRAKKSGSRMFKIGAAGKLAMNPEVD